MKPNIRITTFLGIQIARNHILRNLDARSNVDSSMYQTSYKSLKTKYAKLNFFEKIIF